MHPKTTRACIENLHFWLTIVVSLVGVCACSRTTLQSPTDTISPGQGNLLFADDFSNPSSGWDQETAEEGGTYYEDGAYHIVVNTPDLDIFANPYMSFKNVRVEVEAVKVAGEGHNNFGILCRYQGKNDYYVGIVSSDGYYGILKVKGGEEYLLGRESMQQSQVILGENARNVLRLDCIGSELHLFVNGMLLETQQDADFVEGDVGLLAGAYQNPGVHIAFDNFKVLQP